uniref:T-cell surface glycoprotein CD8 alpha chain n=1 Tax=Gallus gallus TaxID=9031 RepID=A0A8V0YZ20_CHICK
MMAGSPALLLLLSLGLCFTGAQGQGNTMAVSFLNGSMKHPQEGQRLELKCHTYKTSWGVSWIRLDKDGNLHFIVYISKSSRTTFPGNKRASSQFEVSKQGSSYRLVVKSFRARDQGTYFCIAHVNQVLHFSSGQPAFFPVTTTTAAPTTLTATTQSSQVTMKDISRHSPDPGTGNKNMLNSTCEVFLWVRVAGTCLLLLTAITITIMHCQSKLHPDTLQRFLEPHTTEHRSFLQDNGLSPYCPHAAIAYPGHREC